MGYETVVLEKEGRIVRITLNRPEKLNAINDVMKADIEAALKEVESDPELWVVIIKGKGRCFSAGQDLSGVGTSQVMSKDPRERWYLSELWELERNQLAWWQNIFSFPRYTIAQIHGYALGWGCDLAMVCRTSIAADDAVFGDPAIRAGFTTANPLWTWKVGLRKAKELLFTGKYIDGREAARIGLITMSVPSDRLEDEVTFAAEALTVGAPIGGFDEESFSMGFGRTGFNVAGLATAWDHASNIHAISAIQRRGFAPGEYNFFVARDEYGLKDALRERDRPFKELGLYL